MLRMVDVAPVLPQRCRFGIVGSLPVCRPFHYLGKYGILITPTQFAARLVALMFAVVVAFFPSSSRAAALLAQPNQTAAATNGPATQRPLAAASSASVTAPRGNARLDFSGPQLRVAHFDLDPIYGDNDDAAQVLRNIDMLANRVKILAASGADLVVYLSAFSNVDSSKTAYDAMFFPSSQLNERGGALRFNDAELPQGQLFARAARAIKLAAPGVQIYAWMPTLNFRLARKAHHYAISQNSYIQSDLPQEQGDSTQYSRLSPFVGVVWDIVGEIYSDLGTSAGRYIDGIVFHDDGVMTDHEDVGSKAQAFLRSHDWSALAGDDPRAWNELDSTARAIRKSRYLNQFSLHMVAQTQTAIAREFGINKTLGTARHVYSSAFSDTAAVQWLSQEPASLLRDYDFLLIEAYPYMEARNSAGGALSGVTWCELAPSEGCVNYPTEAYFDKLLAAVAAQPNGLDKVVFVMQTVDWNLRTAAVTDLTPALIGQHMRGLFQQGAVHFGWYPDRFFSADAHPRVDADFASMLQQRQ